MSDEVYLFYARKRSLRLRPNTDNSLIPRRSSRRAVRSLFCGRSHSSAAAARGGGHFRRQSHGFCPRLVLRLVPSLVRNVGHMQSHGLRMHHVAPMGQHDVCDVHHRDRHREPLTQVLWRGPEHRLQDRHADVDALGLRPIPRRPRRYCRRRCHTSCCTCRHLRKPRLRYVQYHELPGHVGRLPPVILDRGLLPRDAAAHLHKDELLHDHAPRLLVRQGPWARLARHRVPLRAQRPFRRVRMVRSHRRALVRHLPGGLLHRFRIYLQRASRREGRTRGQLLRPHQPRCQVQGLHAVCTRAAHFQLSIGAPSLPAPWARHRGRALATPPTPTPTHVCCVPRAACRCALSSWPPRSR